MGLCVAALIKLPVWLVLYAQASVSLHFQWDFPLALITGLWPLGVLTSKKLSSWRAKGHVPIQLSSHFPGKDFSSEWWLYASFQLKTESERNHYVRGFLTNTLWLHLYVRAVLTKLSLLVSNEPEHTGVLKECWITHHGKSGSSRLKLFMNVKLRAQTLCHGLFVITSKYCRLIVLSSCHVRRASTKGEKVGYGAENWVKPFRWRRRDHRHEVNRCFISQCAMYKLCQVLIHCVYG